MAMSRSQEVEVKNRLKEVREQKGLSQLKLTMMTGIAPGDISRIENGWLRPYPGWRRRLARALGVSEPELFPAGEAVSRETPKEGQDGH